ncbi:hypothetical protein [Streptomyces sp. NPDC057301]|uniref:hypothetical protein n=1 Tax=Streptomyces sp. NPDC057301 TaxID=3346093 RepID=UPI0036307D75
MTTRLDDDPGDGRSHPDDPLAVLLRSSSPDYLGAPAGQFETVRRKAARRRLLRTAAGAGVCCAVAALVALPLRLAAPDAPATPTVPMAPPATSTVPPTPAPSRAPAEFRSPFPETSRTGVCGRGDMTTSAALSRTPSATPTSVWPVPSAARPSTDRESAAGR